MVGNSAGNWTVRGVTFLLWAAAAASAAYWGLRLSQSGTPGSAVAAGIRQSVPADPAAIARLLGQAAPLAPAAVAPPPMASRFALLGVVADRAQRGAALIGVDGRPPKPFRVGSLVDEGLVLQSVDARRATLAASADGPALVTLELPPPPR